MRLPTLPLRATAALLLSIVPRADLAAQPAPRPGAAQPARPSAALGWMAGCWERRTATRLVEEQWMAPRGGVLLGASRTTRGDTLVEYEAVRVEEAGDTLVYVASPSRQASARFRAVRVGGDSVLFENAAHDFPQRIGYARRGADSLAAWIEGEQGGRPRRMEFPYARAACPR